MSEQISYAKTVYGEDEINAVVDCLKKSTQMGQNTRSFECEIANLFSKKHSLFVNSGSSALYLGIESLNLPKGGEVITPALTFSTTVGSLVKNDLIPVFTDVSPRTFCINCSQIEEMITKKTVAICAPNLLGNICEWDKIREIADKYELKVIEDSADTLGATLNGKSTGIFSDVSITSFYGSHIVNCAGNGGALALNDDEAFKRAKLLRSWGRSSSLFDERSESIENRFNVNLEGIEYDAKFVFEMIGYNLEGSEIGAAFGLKQLEKLNKNISQRKINFNIQTKFFEKYPDIFEVPLENKQCNTAWLAYPILIKDKANFSRRDLQIYLEKQNIQTRVVFTGNIIKQPMCKNINYISRDDGYQEADKIMQNGILLPVHHGMKQEMFDRLHKAIDDFIKNKNIF